MNLDFSEYIDYENEIESFLEVLLQDDNIDNIVNFIISQELWKQAFIYNFLSKNVGTFKVIKTTSLIQAMLRNGLFDFISNLDIFPSKKDGWNLSNRKNSYGHFKDGKLHRTDGPAKIDYKSIHPDIFDKETWYYNGEHIDCFGKKIDDKSFEFINYYISALYDENGIKTKGTTRRRSIWDLEQVGQIIKQIEEKIYLCSYLSEEIKVVLDP